LRCIAVLTAALIGESGSMVMIEELDNGIHPARVYKLVEQLIAIGKERKIDIIITTHNATLLNAYRKDELVGVSVI
jgi:AAA15 family ATPase/GTPase